MSSLEPTNTESIKMRKYKTNIKYFSFLQDTAQHASLVTLISTIGGALIFLVVVVAIISLVSTCMERRATSGTYSPSKREANSIPLPNITSPYTNGAVGENWSNIKPPRPPIERLI